jgi:hypothetical protein
MIPPRIFTQGDQERCKDLIPFAMSQLGYLTNKMTFGNLNQLQSIIVLPDGSSVRCMSVFGLNTIVINGINKVVVREISDTEQQSYSDKVYLFAIGVYDDGMETITQYIFDPVEFKFYSVGDYHDVGKVDIEAFNVPYSIYPDDPIRVCYTSTVSNDGNNIIISRHETPQYDGTSYMIKPYISSYTYESVVVENTLDLSGVDGAINAGLSIPPNSLLLSVSIEVVNPVVPYSSAYSVFSGGCDLLISSSLDLGTVGTITINLEESRSQIYTNSVTDTDISINVSTPDGSCIQYGELIVSAEYVQADLGYVFSFGYNDIGKYSCIDFYSNSIDGRIHYSNILSDCSIMLSGTECSWDTIDELSNYGEISAITRVEDNATVYHIASRNTDNRCIISSYEMLNGMMVITAQDSRLVSDSDLVLYNYYNEYILDKWKDEENKPTCTPNILDIYGKDIISLEPGDVESMFSDSSLSAFPYDGSHSAQILSIDITYHYPDYLVFFPCWSMYDSSPIVTSSKTMNIHFDGVNVMFPTYFMEHVERPEKVYSWQEVATNRCVKPVYYFDDYVDEYRELHYAGVYDGGPPGWFVLWYGFNHLVVHAGCSVMGYVTGDISLTANDISTGDLYTHHYSSSDWPGGYALCSTPWSIFADYDVRSDIYAGKMSSLTSYGCFGNFINRLHFGPGEQIKGLDYYPSIYQQHECRYFKRSRMSIASVGVSSSNSSAEYVMRMSYIVGSSGGEFAVYINDDDVTSDFISAFEDKFGSMFDVSMFAYAVAYYESY